MDIIPNHIEAQGTYWANNIRIEEELKANERKKSFIFSILFVIFHQNLENFIVILMIKKILKKN